MGECFLYGNGSLSDFKIKIIGSTEQPEGKENLIWINTNIEITSYRLSYSKPENVPNGFLWMRIGGMNDDINLDKKNKVVIPVDSAYIYRDGEWVSVDASVFKNGVWTQFSFLRNYLYNTGDQCKQLTGGWKIVNHNSGTSKLLDGYIEVSHNSGNNRISNIHTVSKVNITGYSKLCAELEVADVADSRGTSFGLGTGLALAGGEFTAKTVINKSSDRTTIASVDISSAKSNYVIFYAQNTTAKISAVWLER